MHSNSPYVRVYIGLGSNLLSPLSQVRRAIAELAQLPESRLCAVSRLYRTPPMGPAEQPDYINAVAAIDTRLKPLSLLDALQGIENRHHRQRGAVQWGPRTLDLDLLLYGDAEINESRLTVPHPGLLDRGFVLCPMADIAPALTMPNGHCLQDLCDELGNYEGQVVAQGTLD